MSRKLPDTGTLNNLPFRQGGEIFRSGLYTWQPHTGARSTGTQTLNRLELLPRLVHRHITVDRLAVEVSSGGSAGSVIRFGIYTNLPAEDLPGYPLYESGTVATTGTGLIEQTSVATVLRPGLYWIGIVNQVAQATFRISNAAVPIVLPTSGAPGTGSNDCLYVQTSVSGTLPSPFSTTGVIGGVASLVGIRPL